MKFSKYVNKRLIIAITLLLVCIPLSIFVFRNSLRWWTFQSIVLAYSKQHSGEEIVTIPMTKAPYSDFLDNLDHDTNLYFFLSTKDEAKYYAHAFIFFKPELKNNLTLENFQKYNLPSKSNLNINFHEKIIPGGGAAVVWSGSPRTIKNIQVHFESFEDQVLKGNIEFDVPYLRFSFSKNISPVACLDPGFTPGGYDLCFEDHYAPVNIKVSMPFEIQAN